MSQLLGQLDLPPNLHSWRLPRAVRGVLLVCAGYYAGGVVGLQFNFPPSGITVIWPSTSVLLAALLLTPPRRWWMYLLALVPTHLHLVTHFQHPAPPVVVALCQIASNATEAVLAAAAVRHVIGAPPRFDRMHRMTTFILLAGVATTAIACALAVSLFLLTGWTSQFWYPWRQRVLAGVFPIITIPPLIILTRAGELTGSQGTSLRSYAELGLVVAVLLAVCIPVLAWESPGPGTVPELLLAPLPLLLWAAVRLGPGSLSLCLLVVAAVALTNGYLGRGPFAIYDAAAENVLSLQIFLLAIALPLLLLAANAEERRQAEASLTQTLTSRMKAEQEAKRLEGALRATRTELARVNRQTTVGAMAASIAHEINQPLAALVTNGGIGLRLLAKADLEELRDVLERIVDDGLRASHIIESIRAMFRKDLGKKSPVNIGDLVGEVLAVVHGELDNQRVSLQVQLPQGLPRVMADRVQLQQVILNLIMNAVEAMSSVGSRERLLQVKVEADGAHKALIMVEDSGPGIDPNDMDHIFDPFFSTKSHGMGLGLSICRSIIESHGGRLSASARVPHGAVFCIQLPSGTAVDS